MSSESVVSVSTLTLQRWLLLVAVVALVGCITAILLWQRLGSIQEQLARQSAESAAHAMEARNTARLAQDTAMQTAAKLIVTDARLDEIALQRGQIEALVQSLSRVRDDNLLADMESAIRLAQQQSQLSGSSEPLLAALQAAELRLERVAQPRLSGLRRAIAADLARLSKRNAVDTPALLRQLDEIVRMAQGVQWVHAVAQPVTAAMPQRDATLSADWWQHLRQVWWLEVRNLVRVSRIASPDAALVAPEQAFFLENNLQSMLLNVRLSLLSRQTDAARTDTARILELLQKYSDTSSRKNKQMVSALQQVDMQIQQFELPQANETLAALVQAGAGR
jgi:uroporphyrin-III C-methyltransferase